NDGVITWELMVERINSELANTLGNLVNRTISMSNKYFGGVVNNAGVIEPVDRELRETAVAAAQKASEKMDELRVADAITEIFTLFKRCNKYIDETMPWALAKDETKQDRLATVLYNLVESITIGASLLQPFMPETAQKIANQLHTSLREMNELDSFGKYVSGTNVVSKPEILFARLDVEKTMEKVNELMEAQKAAAGVTEEQPEEAVIDIEIGRAHV